MHSGYALAEILTDGNFLFSEHTTNGMQTLPHSASDAPNNKMWIDLGALFRIYKIIVWNHRICCQDRFIGTHIYADERLIGTAITGSNWYEFKVRDEDPTYASKITLHQPLSQYLHPLEIQVWGNGPFNRNDTFA